MNHRRQVIAVLGGFLLAVAWGSVASAQPASRRPPPHLVFDSTTYTSEQALVSSTQVMVVAKVQWVGVDHAMPASHPVSLVSVRVTNALRGRPGKHLVVVQPRGSGSQGGAGSQVPLKAGRTYLLLLNREPAGGTFFLVGGTAGEFSYNATTKRFSKVDASAAWENSDFTLSLAKAGAQVFSQPAQPSWLTNPVGSPGLPALAWSSMANGLGMSSEDVSCASENLCVFAGEVTPPQPGQQIPAVAVTTGPFTPHSSVVGTTTTFPPSSSASYSYVACAGPALCVLSSVDGVYVTTDPTAAHWTLEVAPSPAYNFGQVSCPTVSFCAVATGSGVLVSASPSSGSSAWAYIEVGPLGQAISCPSPKLCVAGGYGDATIGGWIGTSTNPLVAASWHGGPTPHPQFAQHSGQYGVTGISCPTTSFCVAAVSAGEPLISTDPAGGVGTWTMAANGLAGDPGFATCSPAGQCSVSGVGTFHASAGGSGSGIVGYPLPGVSCVSTSFCVTASPDLLAVGTVPN